MSSSADFADFPTEALAAMLARNTGSKTVMLDEDEEVTIEELRDEVLARYRALPSPLALDAVGVGIVDRKRAFSVAERQALARVSLGIEVAAATFRTNPHPMFAEPAADVLRKLPGVDFYQQQHTRESAVTQRLCIDIYVARSVLTPAKCGKPRQRVGDYEHFEQVLKSGLVPMTSNGQAITSSVINSVAAVNAFVEPAHEMVDSEAMAQDIAAFLASSGL